MVRTRGVRARTIRGTEAERKRTSSVRGPCGALVVSEIGTWREG